MGPASARHEEVVWGNQGTEKETIRHCRVTLRVAFQGQCLRDGGNLSVLVCFAPRGLSLALGLEPLPQLPPRPHQYLRRAAIVVYEDRGDQLVVVEGPVTMLSCGRVTGLKGNYSMGTVWVEECAPSSVDSC